MDLASLKAKGWISRPRAVAPSARAAFPFGLGRQGLHEIAETAYGDTAAATGFALGAALTGLTKPVVWVHEAPRGLEHGHVPAAAFASFCKGPVPQRLDVEVHRTADALWAVEEALASGAPGLVIADVRAADFTATRRLTLASERHQVPVILLLPWQAEGASAAAVRWRLSAAASAPNRFDPQGLGPPGWRAVLERCRPAPGLTGEAFDIGWNDETLSLTVASAVAAGAPRPHERVRAAG